MLDELHALVTKAEEIISRGLPSDSESAPTLRERFLDSRDQLSEFCTGVKSQVVAGVKTTDHAIRNNPYQSLVIAAGVGVLIGVLAGRHTCSRE